MLSKRIWLWLAVLILLAFGASAASAKYGLTDKEKLGKQIFFDERLSSPEGQSCAACHAPEVGWTGPDMKINAHGAVYEGAVDGRFGNRKPPSAAYAGDSPILYNDGSKWIGGMFWDSRATGWTLGDPLAEQAQGPFLNPLEQNNPDASAVVNKVRTSSYAGLFYQVCGKDRSDKEYYECIARSIAAFERSPKVSSFTSKYDAVLAGKATYSEKEKRGEDLFMGDRAKCSNCHVPPLFTDFTYDNLGVPKNPENPFYNMPPEWNPAGKDFIDYGLGGFLKNAGYDYLSELGKMKVPTLRNVDKRPYRGFVKAYAHNGYFKSLEEIVHFYNTRDVPGEGWNGKPWSPAEVSDNVNKVELGNLQLTHQEEEDIVAFMKTLSDGYLSCRNEHNHEDED